MKYNVLCVASSYVYEFVPGETYTVECGIITDSYGYEFREWGSNGWNFESLYEWFEWFGIKFELASDEEYEKDCTNIDDLI